MENEYDQLHELMEKHNLLSLFEHLTFRQKVAKVMNGLKADKDSGEYKYAKLQLARLSAPVSALLVPVLGLGLLSLLATLAPERDASVGPPSRSRWRISLPTRHPRRSTM
jgi:hypothetical protein